MFTWFLIPLTVVSSFLAVNTAETNVPMTEQDSKIVNFMRDVFEEQARPITWCEQVDAFNNKQFLVTAFDCPIWDNFVVFDKSNKKWRRVRYRQLELFDTLQNG